MRILFASAEVSPFAKVGGLADVAGSLPKALTARGHDVRVVMPAYGMVLDRFTPNRSVQFDVRINPYWSSEATLHELEAEGLHLWMIEGPGFFRGAERSEDIYRYGRDAYIFLAQAILEAPYALDWWPEVVHAHDWHMGFVPVLQKLTRTGKWDEAGSCFTIHNLAYQGQFPFDTLDVAGLPHDLFTTDKLECYGGVNFIKSACVYSNQVNTVSPNYAQEIQTEEYGCGLHGLMADMASTGKLSGILNGIDTGRFNPTTDPDLPATFSASDLTGKAECRRALLEECGLSNDQSAPVLGVVSRLSNQKGFDLILEAADRILGMGTRLVVLGMGDPWAAGELRRLEANYPESVKFFERFDVELAQRIYGGSDMFLMPSAFEPCGLGQMFAMRYGTIPIIRATGGLADTVTEGETGFVFEEKAAGPLGDAVDCAVAAFRDADQWPKLVANAMAQDFSWQRSAAAYEAMYQASLPSRAGSAG